MRRLILGTAFVLALLSHPVMAQEARQAAIEQVIRNQITAFLEDDLSAAFSHASPAIKGIFGTPERFGQMVRDGYPMVWRPTDLQFGALREDSGRNWQRVVVRDGEGRFHALDYDMLETGGGWQINGVRLVVLPEVAA
jgi:hypothetical protein